MRRYLVWTVMLLGSAGILGLVGNRLFWGYWLSRPSLADSLSAAAVVIGVSALRFEPSGNPVIVPDRSGALADETSFCGEDSVNNRCLDGNIILALEEKELLNVQTPQVSRWLLEQAWTAIAPDLWHPRVQPRYQTTGVPVSGLAIHFSTQGEEYLLLTRRTSEIANDRYTYSEALLSFAPAPRLREQVHFYFEVAGLEGVGWFHFAVLSLLVLLGLSICGLLVRWLWRRIT